MQRSVLIQRWGGIGDVIMILPVACNLVRPRYHKQGMLVTFEGLEEDRGWMQHYFPQLQYLATNHGNRTQDFSKYDYVLEFDQYNDQFDTVLAGYGSPTINAQELFCVEAAWNRLPYPRADQLSPSFWIDRAPSRREESLLFTKASCVARTMSEVASSQLMGSHKFTRKNPRYQTRLELFQAISQARLVVAPDTGVIHIAEMFKTPWVCLHNTFSNASRHKHYKHGLCVQSKVPCSPCFLHGGCGNQICKEAYDTTELKQAIERALSAVPRTG